MMTRWKAIRGNNRLAIVIGCTVAIVGGLLLLLGR